jgi:hypothetical protein
VFNEPTIRRSGRIITTSYNNNQKQHSKEKSHGDSSIISTKKIDKPQNLSDNHRRKITPSTGKIFICLIGARKSIVLNSLWRIIC